MKALLYPLLFSLSLLASCQSTTTPATTSVDGAASDHIIHFERIEQIADQLKAKATEPLDIPLAQSLIDESKAYAAAYPKANYTPAIVFRAGEVARSIGQYQVALQLFEQVYHQYPESKWAVRARFLEGHTYEDGLKDKKMAAQAYEMLIKRHPNDPLAEQARQLLQVIDQSPEDLIRQFEKQKEQQSEK